MKPMRKTFLTGLALAVLSTIITPNVRADYSNTVASFNPLGYWRLSESVQPPPPDVATNLGSLGSSARGYYAGGSYHPAAGALVGSADSAASFDGASGIVAVPYSSKLSFSGPFTAEGWFNPGATTGSFACPLSCGQFGAVRSGWLIYQSATGWNFRMYNQNAGNTSLSITGGEAPVPGTWYHVAVVYTGTNASIYVNGVATTGVPTGYVPNVNGALTIGKRSDYAFPFFGTVDEVAIYTNVLSAAEILAHYQNGTNAAPATPYNQLVQGKNPIIYDRLNEPSYTAPDPSTFPVTVNSGSLANTADGLIYPGVVTGVAGVPNSGLGANNRAFNFNGATGFIDLGTADGLNLIGPMTATVWVKGNPADGRFQTIVGKGDTSWRVSMDADGFAHFAVGANKDAAGVHNINDGQWHFLAGVYDGTTQAIYVDGTLDGSQPTPSAFFGSAASVTIGGVPDHATDRLFAGSIDEVAIFDSALSLSQIQQIFYSGNIAPLISQQPQLPGSVFEGSALTITVGAVGTPTLNYQWTKNGASITGKTTSSLAFSSIAASDSGSYAVVITNNYGAITSSIVALAVQSSPPYILQQPQAFSRYQGGFGTLSVTAAGTAPLAYQWYFNGTTKIAGATASSYPLSNLQFANAGNYSCTITNTHGATNTVTVALTVVGAPAGAYAATILADNPLAYWRLGETNGTVAHDYLGNHDGQYTNATLGVPGYSAIDTNAAMSIGPQFNSFVGNIQGIDFGTGTNAAFSVEAWVKGPVVQNGDVGFITKGTGAGGEQFNLDNGNGGKYRFFVRGTQNVIQSCNSSIALDGTWQHLVGVCDGPGGSLHLFVNGVEVATTTAPGDILPSTHAVSIGSRQSGSSATGPYDFNFTGSMDEVAIYGTALSATQVQAHYAARYGSSTPAAVGVQPVATTNYVTLQGVFTVYGGGTDPVSYQWKFNGVDIADATSDTLVVSPLDLTNAGNYSVTVSNPFGTTNSSAAHLTVLPAPTVVDVTSGLLMHLKFDGDYRDYSGRGNNGTNVGATTFVPGKIGANALHYFTDSSSASYSYVTLGLRPDLQFSSNVNFSVAFWVRQPAGALQGDLPFLCNALGSTYSPGYVIAPSYKSGGWGWSLYDKTGSTGMGANGGDGTINDGNWHHVVHTFDRNGYGLTYVDGIRVDGRPIVGAGDLNTGQPTNIGQDPTGTYAETGEADIDDFGVWQRVLSPMEISAMYVGGSINGVSFASAPVKMTLQPLGNQLQIVWPAGLLQAADQVTGPYTDVTAATSPYTVTPAAAKKFYRVKL